MTPKHEAFVNEYLKDRNATQAAIRAGYSKRSAHDTGHTILKDPEVSALIAARTAKVGMTADEVLTGLADIARASEDEKVKTSDRVAALVALGKNHKLFTDKVDVTGDVTINVLNPYGEK